MNDPAWIYLLLTWAYFAYSSSVSITDFEQVNTNWEVGLLTKIIQNVISNYIPHETVTCDDRHQIIKKYKKVK